MTKKGTSIWNGSSKIYDDTDPRVDDIVTKIMTVRVKSGLTNTFDQVTPVSAEEERSRRETIRTNTEIRYHRRHNKAHTQG